MEPYNRFLPKRREQSLVICIKSRNAFLLYKRMLA